MIKRKNKNPGWNPRKYWNLRNFDKINLNF